MTKRKSLRSGFELSGTSSGTSSVCGKARLSLKLMSAKPQYAAGVSSRNAVRVKPPEIETSLKEHEVCYFEALSSF